jgi:hypothetical protein
MLIAAARRPPQAASFLVAHRAHAVRLSKSPAASQC